MSSGGVIGGNHVGHRTGQPGARPSNVTTRVTAMGVSVSSATMNLTGTTAGGGIRSISGERGPDGTMNIVIKGELRDGIARQGFEGEVLRAGEVDPIVAGYHRAHMWGAGFGDEARDGIMLAPPSVNLMFQNAGVEKALRDLQDAAGPGGKVLVTVSATSHATNTVAPAGHDTLAHVAYSFEIQRANEPPIRVAQVDITVPPPPVTNPNVQIKREASGSEQGAALLAALRFGPK
jgi:hypothetical protein